jgi:hypothetical protein
VGVDETANHIKYRQCLEQAIQTYQPMVVAEEYSTDALGRSKLLRNRPQEFFTRKVATPWGITNFFVTLISKQNMHWATRENPLGGRIFLGSGRISRQTRNFFPQH